ncbi:MAG TPA: DUF1015 domain-containing protein [Ktedonobacteraceae bacterium]|jgi:uncharacterized protein (DUF1015 family)
MAEVQPFRGLHYSRAFVDDLSQVITPPFDVIDEKAQKRYYERHPYNIIRLELGKTQSGDDTLNNVYTRAAATFSEWRLQGIIQQESQPCYYFYQQRFSYGGQTYTRTSLLARVRLEPWEARVVLPHENTLAKAREDRLQLLRACSANLSPIMCLYEDPQGRLRRLLNTFADQATIQITDDASEEHRFHALTDPQQIELIRDFFSQRQLYIADGHHRYTTALSYQQEILAQRKELNPEDGINFVLMALVDVDDPGMLVLPTHRLLHNLHTEAQRKLSPEHLSRYFNVQVLAEGSSQATVLQALKDAGQKSSSLVVLCPHQTLLLSVNEQGQQAMEQSGHTSAWNVLDVAITQHLVLESVLELRAEDMTAGTYVRYTHDSMEAFESVRGGTSQAALILNATPLRQVCDVAQADDRMPQKSTYLYPKLTTGLIINPLW